MKIVSYNIRFGLGTDHRIDLKRIAETVCDADIIGLQEVERFWKRGGMLDQPDIIGGHLKDRYWVYCPAFDMDASERQDNGSIINRRRQFGPMVLSRWPILASRLIVFPKLGTVKHFNMDTGGIECVVDAPSGPMRIYSIHLSAASPRDRLLQIDYLLAWHRRAWSNGGAWTGSKIIDIMDGYEDFFCFEWSDGKPQPPMPDATIVMGDFNSEPESEEFQRMVGTFHPLYGHVDHLDGFVDSWTVAGERSGDDDCITWWPDPPGRSPGHGLRLDYCFVSPDLGHTVKRAWVDSSVEGSDHRPYWVELDLVRQANWQKVGGASPPERRSNRTTFLREPCVGSREGAGEASVAAWMGRAIEHRKSDGPGCRGFQIGRRQYRRRRFGEMSASPAVSENPCTFARLLLGPWEVFKLPRLS